MKDYADIHHQLDLLTAEANRLLGVAVEAYKWPENLPLPDTLNTYKAETIHNQAYGEDLSLELAAIDKTSETGARFLVGDIAILTERLPLCWQKVIVGLAPLWQARKVAQTCETLSLAQCQIVDELVAPGLGAVGMARLARVITAARLTADPELGPRLAEQHKERFTRIQGDSLDPLSGWVVARLDRNDSIFLDATIQLIADRLVTSGDTSTLDERRATAMGMLANPAAVIQLLGVHTTRKLQPLPANADDADQVTSQVTSQITSQITSQASKLVSAFTPRVHMYIHIAQDCFADPEGWYSGDVARVETIGPVLLDQLKDLTHGCRIQVTPVVHLTPTTMGVDSYELPDYLRTHVILANRHDVFPFSSIESRALDIDHTIPFTPGVPNQTRIGNLAPMSRRAHRAKTHAGWKVDQPRPGSFIWTSPAGQYYLVDHTGSHRLDKRDHPPDDVFEELPHTPPRPTSCRRPMT